MRPAETLRDMQAIITAVGPDNVRLADPIVHYVTNAGANIREIQMYDRDDERVFAMMLRLWIDTVTLDDLREGLDRIAADTGLSIRAWARGTDPARLAICTTYRQEPVRAVLDAIRVGRLDAVPAVLIGNRPQCESVAKEFGVPWECVGDDRGEVDNLRMVELFDEHRVDYIVLARYMRVLPAATCWQFAGGRIINLHHGLLPPFPGLRPYRDAFASRMLTYGATVHFIVPELDAGNQIIHQSAFSVAPGTSLEDIRARGQVEHEPGCLVEGLRRVLDREVELHFHRVVAADRTGD